jgi:fatty acyl-CoA reductase
MLDLSNIASFYEGRSVFITGATGFMGKVLVEKLLRSCCGIKHLFLLMRQNNDNNNKRLQDFIENKVVFLKIIL